MSGSTPMPTPPRPWAASSSTGVPSTSTPVASPSAIKRRPSPHVLSPLSSFGGSPSSMSINTSYQPSNMSQTSLLSPRYSSYSAAPSLAGSTATLATTQPGGPTRFRRGHARKKATPSLMPVVKPINPDELDLMQLEDPDEVFRLFGVRDVRGLEKRASDAAAAKVAELRTMVGERYRDLLSAADSIVRMRSAAEKLVESLERVETGVSVADEGDNQSPIKRTTRHNSHASEQGGLEATLASPPTLSLTIQLLLFLPSHVESLLETASFLEAARLEGVGRAVHHELATYSDDTDDDDARGRLLDAFPIIERQWENVSSLGSVIVRRANAELRRSDFTAMATAQTLAAIVMLESASLSTVLTSLLQARSNSLSEILHNHGQRIEGAREVEQVQSDLVRVLDLVLHTVEAAEQIFGTTPDRQPAGLLVQLLQEIEKPTGSHAGVALPQLAPPLCSLPNYSLLSRHLPASILEFRPFLSVSTSQNVLSPTDAQTKIREWALTESNRVVEEVTTWIKSLSGGARTLSLVRDTIKKCLEKKATLTTQSLQAQLEQMIEARLETVYRAQLTALVECVTPCLESLLRELPKSDADLSTAYLLFESPLSFPPTQHYALSAARHGKGANAGDPFDGFLKEVRKRVQGRSPLLERGVGEIEGQARQLRVDLQDWVGDEVTTKSTNDENAAQLRLRQLYLTSAQETLTGIHAAVSRVLKSVSRDIDASLFLGNFTFLLSASPTFTRDLLLGTNTESEAPESTLVATWRKRIAELQAQTLVTWRVHAVDRSINKIKDSMNVAAASSPAAMLWAWDASATSNDGTKTVSAPLPTQPSPAILSSLRTLVAAVLRVGLHRTQQDPTIARSLLQAFEVACEPIVRAFVGELEAQNLEDTRRRGVAVQAAWDVAFLLQVWARDALNPASWRQLRARFLEIAGVPSEVGDTIDASARHYLQRTQTIFYAILPANSQSQLNNLSIVDSDDKKTSITATPTPSSWLPLGPPPIGSEFKSLVGLVKPGPRLGLLPTRS